MTSDDLACKDLAFGVVEPEEDVEFVGPVVVDDPPGVAFGTVDLHLVNHSRVCDVAEPS